MTPVTHLIGLTNLEAGTVLASSTPANRKARTAAAIAARYQQIAAGGWLIARRYLPGWRRGHSPGRSFAYDELAGESGYVFLETHSRYTDYYAPALYGWQFDAEQLVAAGALVCDADLGSAFDDAIYQACAEIAATLPRLARTSEAEIAALLGENDPELLAYVAEASTDPLDALHQAVLGHETVEPMAPAAIRRARALAAKRCKQIKAQRRVRGRGALALLHSGNYCEIVMPERLAIAWAIAAIEGGHMYARR